MQDTAESATLRTMLKNINREYTATLRAQEGEGRELKLEGLKRQRLALMSSIAELRGLVVPRGDLIDWRQVGAVSAGEDRRTVRAEQEAS